MGTKIMKIWDEFESTFIDVQFDVNGKSNFYFPMQKVIYSDSQVIRFKRYK